MTNYKGIYFGDDNEKFHDEDTGAHFQYKDLYQRMLVAAEQRKIIDKQLKINFHESPSHNESPNESPPGLSSGKNESSGRSGNISDRDLDEMNHQDQVASLVHTM